MKVGDKAKASPQLTGETEWVEGKVIDIEQNPFRGTVISIEDGLGRIYSQSKTASEESTGAKRNISSLFICRRERVMCAMLSACP